MKRTVAILGGGVIGGGWAARFALMGWDVRVFDPGAGAEAAVRAMLERARAALPALYDVALPDEGRLTFHDTISAAVAGAEWIQESAPERLALKRKLYQQVQAVCDPAAIIGSSTSGFTPSELQGCATRPEQIIVAHPFNPVYLLPLVELVGSQKTDPALLDRATDLMTGIGMNPLKIRKEMPAHVADRFLEAVWREALWLVRDGVATTQEIDDAIRMGFGLRWAQMGLFENYRIAGGEAGMRHFMAQFGPCLSWPWTKLTDVPEFNEALVDLVAGQSDAQSGHIPIRDLERMRDQNLVGILRSLKDRNAGAGKVLRAQDARWAAAFHETLPNEAQSPGAPLVLTQLQVLPGWIDYNGHMTESRYLFAASETTDAFLRLIGADLDYVKGGHSYYTAETHILHRGEAKLGDALRGTLQVLAADSKRLHVFVRILKNEAEVATVEQMLLHVDMSAGRVCPAPVVILDRLLPIAGAHLALPRPDTVGRHVGQGKV